MRKWMLAALEVVGVALTAAGIAAWSVPAACIALGVTAVAIGELRS